MKFAIIIMLSIVASSASGSVVGAYRNSFKVAEIPTIQSFFENSPTNGETVIWEGKVATTAFDHNATESISFMFGFKNGDLYIIADDDDWELVFLDDEIRAATLSTVGLGFRMRFPAEGNPILLFELFDTYDDSGFVPESLLYDNMSAFYYGRLTRRGR